VTAPGAVVPAGPWLEFIRDKPMLTLGAYAQLSTGKLLGDHVKAVLGLRTDRESFDFVRIQTPGQPTDSKTYAETSPRLALIVMPTTNLAIKGMYGSAFRAPSPSEIAGANTYSLASNIDGLKPETIQTFELAVDWIISANLNWRSNIYRTKFADQIAYSIQNANLSTNVYTLTTQGLETELLFGFSHWKGYANLSWARREHEQILDNTIAASGDLTWEPSVRAKAGAIYSRGPVTVATSAIYQGPVKRRSTDITPETEPYRSSQLDGWFVMDLKAGWNFNPGTSLSISISNLTDTHKNVLIKNMAYPFDYQGQGRRWALTLRSAF